jgi:hypothetical protein
VADVVLNPAGSDGDGYKFRRRSNRIHRGLGWLICAGQNRAIEID